MGRHLSSPISSMVSISVGIFLAAGLVVAPPTAAPAEGRAAPRLTQIAIPSKIALARDINESGDVAGSFMARDGFHAFYTRDHHVVDLGLGDAYAINDAGQVTGDIITPDGDFRAFYTDAGQVVDIGPGFGYDINNAGVVVGVFQSIPFRYADGVRETLPTLDGGGFPYAINDRGQIVGESEWGIPFLYDAAGLHDLRAQITTAGSGQHLIWGLRGINATGQVIGELSPAAGGTGEAFSYDLVSGAFRVLTPLIPGDFSYPGGINDAGQVVGWARPVGTSGTGLIHAVLWTGSEVRDLGTLGGADSTAYAINDAGVITGGAALRSGIERPYLLPTR
jgi:probable HAF family extracellular repeat protein